MSGNTSIIARVALIALTGMLGACASSGQATGVDKVTAKEIARVAGCGRDEVAVCIEIDCDPHEYRCAARDDVAHLFRAREFRY